jgi:hypothetical protein
MTEYPNETLKTGPVTPHGLPEVPRQTGDVTEVYDLADDPDDPFVPTVEIHTVEIPDAERLFRSIVYR